MSGTPLVYVVDDNPDLREALRMLLEMVQIEVMSFATAEEFLERATFPFDRPVCLLLDVRMPGMSGIALLKRLKADKVPLSTIVVTGHGDIDMAVRAMKLGAVDFITKPFNSQRLLDRIQEVLRQGAQRPPQSVNNTEAATRIETLTVREREVFDRIVLGASNKAMARDLGISVRTIESHRARIMKKLHAQNLVELVNLSVILSSIP